MGPHADFLHRELRPYASVDARDAEIERDDRKSREHLFHKGLSSRPDPAGHCAMNPVKKLRCGDRRERDLRRPVLRDDAVPVEQTTLGRDQDAGIDQGRQATSEGSADAW